jgi:hypothetical protein
MQTGHQDQSLALVREGIDSLNPSWGDYPSLEDNYLSIVTVRLHDLYSQKDPRTMLQIVVAVAPQLSRLRASSKAPKTLERLAWVRWNQAWALMQTGREDEALALVRDALGHVDASWTDAAELKDAYPGILTGRMHDLYTRKEYRAVIALFGRGSDVCRAAKACLENASAAYIALAIDPWTNGDWPTARQVLRECTSNLPDDSGCGDRLKELESQHRF